MKIRDLELFLVQVQSSVDASNHRCLLVRLALGGGLEGWGEAPGRWSAEELDGRRDVLLAQLRGRSIFDIEELLRLETLREPELRCALETACWDLVARAAGQPLCHLFGGGYRQRIPVALRLTGSAPSRVGQLAGELADQGFHAQIVTSSGDPQQDLEMVRAVQESTGQRAEIRLDGNGRYDAETARDLCAELEYESIRFFIDPLSSMDLFHMASLRRQTSVPLAARRAIRRPADMLALIRCGAASSVIVDAQHLGGLLPARKCAAIVEAADLNASVGGGPSVGIHVAAMLHLVASTPGLASGNECAYQLSDDLLTEPLEVSDGMIAVPQNPGLGVEVDRDKLEQYQVG